MDDLISRQAAIQAVGYYSLHSGEKLLFADKPLKELPSAQETGTWIDYQKGKWIYAQCNKCGTVWDVKSNYCPHCGAKMEGEQDGND